jgi:hypothetical protein
MKNLRMSIKRDVVRFSSVKKGGCMFHQENLRNSWKYLFLDWLESKLRLWTAIIHNKKMNLIIEASRLDRLEEFK